MEEIIYRTVPRFFIVSITMLGSVFFGLLTCLVSPKSLADMDITVTIIMAIFLLGALGCFYFFITMKQVKLTKEN